MPDDNGDNKVKDVKKTSALSNRVKRILEKRPEIQSGMGKSLRTVLDQFVISQDKLDAIEASALRKLRKGSDPCCSLCGRGQKEVSELFSGYNGHICNKCLEDRI